MDERLDNVEEETFLVFDNSNKLEFVTSHYNLAEFFANKMAIKNDTSYTICKYNPVDMDSLKIKPYIQVRMSYNSDYDEYAVLSLKERDEAKEDSIITSDDDESVVMCKMYIKYKEDSYESIIEKAKNRVQKLIKK